MSIHRLFSPAAAACTLAMALVTAVPAAAAGHHLPPRRGGAVHTAWPRRSGAGQPQLAMARWLARQVGPVAVSGGRRIRTRVSPLNPLGRGPVATMASGSVSGWNPNYQVTAQDPPHALALVRSYAIPSADPGAARLANLSWTDDSAVSATAFSELGDTAEARQLLDQLAALQRGDGSIDVAYDASDGASVPLLRSGTVAWVGLAGADYRRHTCSSRYDTTLAAAARWLLARQVLDRTRPSYGLLTGGPDVAWVPTQPNLVARALFANLADLIDGVAEQSGGHSTCGGGLSGMPAQAASTLAARLRRAVALIDAGIDRALLITPSATSAHFVQGVDDGVIRVDTQALGIMWLIGQGRQSQAAAVRSYTDAAMLLGPQTTGPFIGYRPYANVGSPDALWMAGTLEMRDALAQLGADTTGLDLSALSWTGITGTTAPLQANATVTGTAPPRYHVWPSSAAAAWALLNLTPFSSLSHA